MPSSSISSTLQVNTSINKPLSRSKEVNKDATAHDSPLPAKSAANKDIHSEERYQALIREEILSFEKELASFRSRAANLNIHVGSQDEKVQLKKSLADMDGFRKLLIETTSSQCREISQLKKVSLENLLYLKLIFLLVFRIN